MPSPTRAPIYPLHIHSTMSVLDGASEIGHYADYCRSSGLEACAITDHGMVLGLPDLLTACKEDKKKEKVAIKPIAGCEFYLMPRADHVFAGKEYEYYHLTVWAKDLKGYQNLLALSSASWAPGRPVTRYGRKLPRIAFEDLVLFNEGLIIGSGCIEGPIGKCIRAGERDMAVLNCAILHQIFGDRMFFELMPHGVVRNFHKEAVIEVLTEDGEKMIFHPEDLVQTEWGPMTASEAMTRRVDNLFGCTPTRMQQFPFNLSDREISVHTDDTVLANASMMHLPREMGFGEDEVEATS